ncbi:MAG: TIGR00730 family Rossman fold protein [Frankiales bacterium]|nr:TIGR00730 family Rossman fold protein [Frankiales bacterium]
MATICVFCASSEHIDQRYVDLAAEVGTELARRGHELVSGGGSVSCMGAVANAARAGGARTVGVIPGQLLEWEVADEAADELIVTPDMRVRKGEMDRRADAFLTLPGGLGTLEELLEIWVARVLRMHDKPLVVLDPDGVFAPLRQQVDELVAAGFARPSVRDAVAWASDVASAFDLLEQPRPQLPPAVEEVLESEP